MAALPETARATDLYERYASRLYGFCLNRLGSREEAEDAVQTTFLNAFLGLRRGIVPELEAAWVAAREDPDFLAELGRLLRDFAGRPTPLYHAQRRGKTREIAGDQ